MNRFLTSSYQQINILVAIVIILIFIYSALFAPTGSEYPVSCVHVGLLGEDCSTCGLSRSFSEMIRGNFRTASAYNTNGPLLFAFFALQLVMRAATGFILLLNAGRQAPSQAGKGLNETSAAGQGWAITGKTSETGSGISEAEAMVPGSDFGRHNPSVVLREGILAKWDIVLSLILFVICFRNLLLFWI